MSSALRRGRTLNPRAVAYAVRQHEIRRDELLARDRATLTARERSEVRKLTGRWDFWNYVAPKPVPLSLRRRR
jgi:hypothetical protein